MDKIIDDYIYINYTNFDKLNTDIPEIKMNENTEYTLIDKINKNKSIPHELLCSKISLNNDICISIDSEYFFDSIRKSFPSYNKIWEQFLKDIERCECYLNNNIIDKSNLFIFEDYLKKHFSETKMYDIIMLCTQAVMAYSFEIIQNSIKDKYLSEINIKKKYDLLQIFIFKNEEEITFNIKKRMRIFKLDRELDDVTTEYILFNIEFNLDKDEYILMKINLEK